MPTEQARARKPSFEPVPARVNFAEGEERILLFWERHGTFARSLEQTRNGPEFVFYDGPPFATGLPHYGHLLAGTIKDIVPRYQTMRGRYVDRRFGWDCHGLPVEYEVERDLQISGRTEIERLGVDAFNERCRGIVLRYTREWRHIVRRMGRWVDFERGYKTMDPAYMESIWWVFKRLWDQKLLYEGQKILPYCPRCSTPLSNFETNQGYRDVQDPAVTVRFRLLDEDNAWILAWTTTPWTLPSNTALAVGSAIRYARVKTGRGVYYVAQERLHEYEAEAGDGADIRFVSGAELVGRPYEPLFPFFASLRQDGAFRIVAGDFVSTEDGTGVVHVAPGFGEDDHRLAAAERIPVVCPVDAEGRFTHEVPDYAGCEVKQTDNDILKRLRQEGALVRRSTRVHSYPHCWRCDTPLIYRTVSTWFVRVEALKDRLLAANASVNWIPGHLREGRFGNWLEGARDWAISRNRYWGTPLPVWRREDGGETLCIGSIEELEARSGRPVTDLHKHFVDRIEIPSADGTGTLKRVPEVLDCWFESGAMPYAQAHYPFEHKRRFETHFPADFIAEGLDQTRGWFYTLMVLSVALFDKPAFRNVVVNGLVLAEDGRKMSKRLKNYPDPEEILRKHGADALRLYLIHSPAVRAADLRFSEEGVRQVVRELLLPLWNAYAFFVTYANVDGWTPQADAPGDAPDNILDRWIRSSLATLVTEVTQAMEAFDLQGAVKPFVCFVEDLTNWYIRRSRRRFWKSQDDGDKQAAYRTLHAVLLELSKVAAPFLPFISETIYGNLRSAGMPESVHLSAFPTADDAARDPHLERRMQDVLTVVRLGRLLRRQHELKIRQPLSALHVVSSDADVLGQIREIDHLVADELNVKRVVYDGREDALVRRSAKPNYRRLGPRFGKHVKQWAAAVTALDEERISCLADGGSVSVACGGETAELHPEDVQIERRPRQDVVVASEGGIVVALETALDDALVLEGLAREEVNRIQNARKGLGLAVDRRIRLDYGPETHADVRRAHEAFREYIDAETLCVATAVCRTSGTEAEGWNTLDLNGRRCVVRIRPVDERPPGCADA